MYLNNLDSFTENVWISGLLNLRGFDIPSAALFLGFLIVKREGFEFFVDSAKLSAEITKYIVDNKGEIHKYEDITNRLEAIVSFLIRLLSWKFSGFKEHLFIIFTG